MTDSTSTLAVVLTELGWKPEVLARRLNSVATMHGCDERVHAKTPYKWLRGDRPRSPWPALVAALLTEELGRPITTADLGWGGDIEAVSAISGRVLPWTVAGSLHAVRVVTDAGSIDRRMLLTLLGAAACTPAHEWLIARPDAGVARSSGSPLPVGIVDHLDGIVGRLRRMDDQLGGETLLPLVRAHLRHVQNLLDQRRYTDTVGRRLHATAAELMRLAGWSAWESGHEPQAQRYWVAAILDLRAAEAHACDQASTECRRALDTAFDRLGDTPGSSGEPDWCYWIDEAQTHAFAGYCYLYLQDWGRARQHLRAALRLRDPSYARDGALDHIKLATTYLRQDQPEVDHAVTPATRAVETLTGEVDSTHVVGHLARLVGDLAPYRRRPAVRQFTEQAVGLSHLALMVGSVTADHKLFSGEKLADAAQCRQIVHVGG